LLNDRVDVDMEIVHNDDNTICTKSVRFLTFRNARHFFEDPSSLARVRFDGNLIPSDHVIVSLDYVNSKVLD
jgi:hypothetical protein